MVEPECAVVDDGHERAGVHGRLQPDPNPAGILAHDLRELVRVRRPAADREHRGKSPRRRRRPEPRLQHRRAEVARERIGRCARLGGEARNHEPGEVRIAARVAIHVVHERLVRRSPEQQLQLSRRPRSVQRPEREFGRAGQASDVRQPTLERMPQPDLARPEGRDDGEPAGRRSCDHVHDRVQRRAVGPLQVVDHQHDRPLRAPPIQPGVEPEDELALLRGDLGEVLARLHDCAQRRSDGQERDRHRCQRQARAGQHRRRPLAVRTGPGHEGGLADAGITGDHDRLRLARRRVAEDTADDGQLIGSAHHGPREFA